MKKKKNYVVRDLASAICRSRYVNVCGCHTFRDGAKELIKVLRNSGYEIKKVKP